jgi:hypothetical protein
MPDTRLQILALRVAADLLEMSISEGADLTIRGLIADEATLHEATFDTAADQDHLDLDLFDPAVFAQLVNEVKVLLARGGYSVAVR